MATPKPAPNAPLLERIQYWFAIGFGSGLSPIMPGTMGTVVGVILFIFIHQLPLWLFLGVLLLATVFGIWICDCVAPLFGTEDPSAIVWDEIVGYWWTMLFIPAGWQGMLLRFVWFRIFDIVKPWPIRWSERKFKGGLGIMIDDVLAAVYVWLVILVMFLWHHFVR